MEVGTLIDRTVDAVIAGLGVSRDDLAARAPE